MTQAMQLITGVELKFTGITPKQIGVWFVVV